MRYWVASESAASVHEHMMRPEGFPPGPVRVPGGVPHAVLAGATVTVCGVDLADLELFPDHDFGRGFRERCGACVRRIDTNDELEDWRPHPRFPPEKWPSWWTEQEDMPPAKTQVLIKSAGSTSPARPGHDHEVDSNRLARDDDVRTRLLAVADAYADYGAADEVWAVASDRQTANHVLLHAGVPDDQPVWVVLARGEFSFPNRQPPNHRRTSPAPLKAQPKAFLLILGRDDLHLWDWSWGGDQYPAPDLLGAQSLLRSPRP
jgi:hypothetical protein